MPPFQPVHQRLLKVVHIEKGPITRPNKCCWECYHILFSTSSPAYSDMAPGSDFGLSCGKSIWELDTDHDNESTMGRFLQLAEKCPHFEQRPLR